MKNKRQEMIINIINNNSVDTQETLQNLLKANGYDVTQATVSRDIRELQLVKKVLSGGGFRYSFPMPRKNIVNSWDDLLSTMFAEAVIKIDYAMNTVCILCHVGMAQAVCARLDNARLSGVVGTLAGDDTIFILMKTEAEAAQLVSELNSEISANDKE